MILVIDCGNTNTVFALYSLNNNIEQKGCWRINNDSKRTADIYYPWLLQMLNLSNFKVKDIKGICIASVVPETLFNIKHLINKYFKILPLIVGEGNLDLGLKVNIDNPKEAGADRLVNSYAAEKLNLSPAIIIDFGTATTFCAVSQDKVYHGGAIIPGIRLSTEALTNNTAKLPSVEIVKKEHLVGRTTIESIQSGVYYAALGACREIITGMQKELFADNPATIIATGGFASLFDAKGLFDSIVPDLVLQGIRFAALHNR